MMKYLLIGVVALSLVSCTALSAKHSGNPDGISQDVYDQTHGRNNVAND